MASSEDEDKILSYLRGANLSYNDFRGENFPHSIDQWQSLKWLKLNRSQLDWIPEEFKAFEKLEELRLAHNNLSSLHGELICLKNLKLLDCRHNKICGNNIPVELFNIKTLTVLDLSYNNLKVIPKNLEDCKAITVLNLSHNNLKNINEQLFVHLTELVHLDLSDNELKTIPPQLGRVTKLRTLILNNNPLEEAKIRQIERLKALRTLHLANTHRNTNNTEPFLLGELTNLVELNLSSNQILKVTSDLSNLKELRRLNLSENAIETMPEDFGNWWPKLETLNLSRNKLSVLPPTLCKLCNLKRIYLNDNSLTFDGLPAALGKLHQLELFMAARNNLESIPESIFRCGRLKKLILASNKLITLPDTIHLLYDLEVLDLSDNPGLIMPPKPLTESQKNSEFYNIDFSLDTQLRLAGDPNSTEVPSQQQNGIKDPIARRLRLIRHARDEAEDENNQAIVLRGMRDIVKEKDILTNNQQNCLEADLRPRRWDEILERPPIDYSELFKDAGQIQGLTIWDIEKFKPEPIKPSDYGKFFIEDCYIVLSTHIDENLSLNWKIFYWIGSEASLDKKACAAIHAVGLRNHLNAYCRTVREEQDEESDEFLALFPDKIELKKGGGKESGFFVTEEMEYPPRIFRLHEVAEKSRQLHLETVAVTSNSLDSRFVFLIVFQVRKKKRIRDSDTEVSDDIDTEIVRDRDMEINGYKETDIVVTIVTKILIWNGMKSKNTTRQKARLLAEKLNKEEWKNKAELIFCEQGDEPPELLLLLDLNDPLPKMPFRTIDLHDNFDIDNYQPRRPVFYQVITGSGYIELLQIDFKLGNLSTKCLVASNVYILDCLTDVFVWWGRKSRKEERRAGLYLAQKLFVMLKRPNFANVTHHLQGTESQLFKSKFRDWDDVIAVDYTRTAESVSKTGANLSKWMSEQKVKIDLASLFAPMPLSLTEEEAEILIEDWNDELELIETFFLNKGKRFSELPHDEFGHFYSEDCYVFLCRYYVPPDDSGSIGAELNNQDNQENRLPNGVATGQTVTNGEFQSNQDDDFKCVVYFWQGRQASKMGWLTFTFSLRKKFEALFGNKLEVVQMHQQQENIKFLSHFKQKFIIHQGKRSSPLPNKSVSLYHLRSNRNPLTLRCIEIDVDSSKLNSGFCYLLRTTKTQAINGHSEEIVEHMNVSTSTSSTIYVWVGSKSDPGEAKIAMQIANEKFATGSSEVQVILINEGMEPDEFWNYLGGKNPYETDASYMKYLRLFRCSNDKGYFCISEKCSDFCQDDLSDDDIMILDNGNQVFLWVGPKSSEVEVKLAYKSAQVYVQNLRLKDPNPRQLMLTFKGKESKKFTKCFHAWSNYKVIQDPRP